MIGLFTLVFVVFLFLKLGEIGPVAEWSWWWVTAPVWGPWLIFFLVAASIAFLAYAAHNWRSKS